MQKKNIIKITSLILVLVVIALIILLYKSEIVSLGNRIKNYINASTDETVIDYDIIKKDGENIEIMFIIKNSKGIEQINIGDMTLYCKGKTQIAVDKLLKEGESISFNVKLIGEETQELHTYIADAKPKMSLLNNDTLGDGTTKTIEIEYPEIEGATNYYSLDNGETWQIYIGNLDVLNTQKQNILAKFELSEGKTINKQVSYADYIDFVQFGEVTWENEKASVEINSLNKKYIEYQINATDGTWQAVTNQTSKVIVNNLQHGHTVYARINNGTDILDEACIKIEDTNMPEEFELTMVKVKYNNIKISGSTKDNETGLATYSYIVKHEGEIVKEVKGQTVAEYLITDLTEETEYVVYMLAYDKAGNVRKSNEVTVTTPKYVSPVISSTSTSSTPRKGKQLPFTWEEIADIAKSISNTPEVTNNTSELTVTAYGEEYIIGVADYTYLNGKKVRILGFNHDDLVDQTIYKNEDGKTNIKAGISFEYVDFIMNECINSAFSNTAGWGGSSLRSILNNTTVKNLSNNKYIKQVKKTYMLGSGTWRSQVSSDYLWLLGCSEIWNRPRTNWSGAVYGGAGGKEGEQYKYYKQIVGNTVAQAEISALIRNSSGWWLRSTYFQTHSMFCFVVPKGYCDANTSTSVYGIAPCFSI